MKIIQALGIGEKLEIMQLLYGLKLFFFKTKKDVETTVQE